MKETLRQVLNGKIWKIQVEEKSSIIAIETRDMSHHITSFSAFDFEAGVCFFKEITVENSWWHGLDKIYGDTILLHGYKNETSPEHKAIIALDLSGKIKWHQFNMALENISPAGIVAYNTVIYPKQFVVLSVKNGEEISKAPFDVPSLTNSIVLPKACQAACTASFIPQNTEGIIFKLNFLTKTIWSFHTKKDGLLDQHLLIEEGGKVVFKDKLSTGIQKINPEAFFLVRGFLFYIRNKNEIISYSL